MEEKNTKLAEWAGWTQEFRIYSMCWVDPNGDGHDFQQPNFTKSPDACCKWLMPKVLEEYDITIYTDDGYYFAQIREKSSNKIVADSVVGQLELAPALCLAIEKLIAGGKYGNQVLPTMSSGT